MAEICEAAELSAGAIYGYFDGKEAIVRGAADAARGALARLEERALTCPTAREGLNVFIGALTGCTDTATDESVEACRLEVGLWAGTLSSPYLHEITRDWYEMVVPAIAELVIRHRRETRSSGGVPADIAARAAVAAIQGGKLQLALGDRRPLDLGRQLVAWLTECDPAITSTG